MAKTGIVRRVDDLGRVVIPIELRKTLGIAIKDPLSISVEGSRVIMEKYTDACIICGNENLKDSLELNSKHICHTCAETIAHG